MIASAAPKYLVKLPTRPLPCDSNASQEYFGSIGNSIQKCLFSEKNIEYRSTFFNSNQQNETERNTVAGIFQCDRYGIISAISRSKPEPVKNELFDMCLRDEKTFAVPVNLPEIL